MSNEILQKLLQDLDSGNENVRQLATKKLSDMGQAILPTLLQTLSDPKTKFLVRKGVTDVVVTFGDAAVSGLLDALQVQDYYVRWDAIAALGRIGNPMAVPALIAIFERGYESAGIALGQIRDERAIPTLANALNNSNSDTVIQRAAEGLELFGEAGKSELFVVATREENSSIDMLRRTIALGCLMRLGDTRSVSILQSQLKTRDWVDLSFTMVAHPKSSKAIPVLIEFLTEETYSSHNGKRVCDMAALALERIGTPEALAAVEAWRQTQT
jgi:HEAT repeat protein